MDNKKGKNEIITKISIAPIISLLVVLWFIQVWIVTPGKPINYQFEIQPLEKLTYDISDLVNYPNLMVVKLNKDKTIYLNAEKVNKESLQKNIYNYCKDKPNEHKVVYIKASKNLSYSYVCEIIDDLKGAGIVFIKLQIDYLDN